MFETQGGTWNRTAQLQKKGSAFITFSDHWTYLFGVVNVLSLLQPRPTDSRTLGIWTNLGPHAAARDLHPVSDVHVKGRQVTFACTLNL